MDIFDELEQMDLNASVSDLNDEEQVPSQETILRWQQLFGYTYADAVDMIDKHRGNLSRKRVNDEHWEIVREEKEAQGYDREAYEHELGIGRRRVKPSQAKAEKGKSDTRERHIVKLEEDLTAEMIRGVSGANESLEDVEGSGEDGDARFCVVDSCMKQVLLE